MLSICFKMYLRFPFLPPRYDEVSRSETIALKDRLLLRVSKRKDVLCYPGLPGEAPGQVSQEAEGGRSKHELEFLLCFSQEPTVRSEKPAEQV